MEGKTVEEGKTMAIISYITIIGLLIAFFMNKDKKNEFTQFHIRQSIGLAVLGVINSFAIATFIPKLAGVIGLIIFVFIILGIVNAVKGEDKALPLVGDQFQEWFKNIGNTY